jgi:ribulose-5-phosphate 4-epimerase/fuculose-1-phosphate aldolase
MMRGHGVTTVGASVEEAALAAIHLNDLATVNYQANLLGDPVPISKEDQEAFRRFPRSRERPAAGTPAGRAAALWRYYCALTAD